MEDRRGVREYIEFTEEDREVYDRLVMPVDTNINIDSVILSEENSKKLMEFLEEYKHNEQFIKYGLSPMNKLLFYGASGTGKTYLAKALANKLKMNMLYIDIARGLTEGNASRSISEIFRLANRVEKCILFLDEADSIAWNRGGSDSESGDIRRATNSVFQQVDQMSVSNIFIAATNILFKMDPAFERRFNMKMEFRRPEVGIDKTIEKFVLAEFTLIDDVNSTVKEIVERRSKLSFYEIKDIVERNEKKAIMRGTKRVHMSEIYNDIATAVKFKIKFKTDEDTEDVFKSSVD